MRPSWRRHAAAPLLLLFSLPLSAGAQVPGDVPIVPRDIQHARYVGEVVEELRTVLSDWSERWKDGDWDRLSKLYADSCLIHLPGAAATVRGGAEDLAEAFRQGLPRIGEVRVGIVNADANRRLAYVTGRYTYTISPRAGEEVGRREGTHLILFRKEKGWRIQSHLFRPRK